MASGGVLRKSTNVGQNHLALTTERDIQSLLKRPRDPLVKQYGATELTIRIGIPDYQARISAHYSDIFKAAPAPLNESSPARIQFENFGLLLDFGEPTEIPVHDDDRRLDENIRGLIARFGPVIFGNAYLPEKIREMKQRNIFPSLRFHFDRGPDQPRPYSLFTRNPFDSIQREPRDSSTLFVANIVAVLQYLREKRECDLNRHAYAGVYQIFEGLSLNGLIGDILLEQAWDRPRETGELCMLDNRTILHASYYRSRTIKGYPIGVRYLD